MSRGGVVLVTGVGQGYGRAVALGWGRAGYDVVCADRDVDRASKTAAEVEEVGGQAIPIQIDVTLPLDVNLGFAKVDELFGRLDGVVHIATRASAADALTLADAEFDELVSETLRSSHLLLRTAGRRMQQGFIVIVAPPTSATTPHNAMVRGGLASLVEGFDARLAKQRVNMVVPSRPASDPTHDAALVHAVLYLARAVEGGPRGATLAIELPKPPRAVERLLPEIRAALDDRIRQDDLEATYIDHDDDVGDEEIGEYGADDSSDDVGAAPHHRDAAVDATTDSDEEHEPPVEAGSWGRW